MLAVGRENGRRKCLHNLLVASLFCITKNTIIQALQFAGCTHMVSRGCTDDNMCQDVKKENQSSLSTVSVYLHENFVH
jgi:hypothetical protein